MYIILAPFPIVGKRLRLLCFRWVLHSVVTPLGWSLLNTYWDLLRHWAPLGGAACEVCTITCLNPLPDHHHHYHHPTPRLSPGIKSCTGAKSISSLHGMEPQKWVNRDPETEDTKGNNFYTLPSLTAVNLPTKAQVSSS